MAERGPFHGDPESTLAPVDETLEGGDSGADGETIALDGLRVPRADEFVVGKELGRGGLGRVMSVLDRKLKRTVALKELLQAGGAQSSRFLREATLTARLQHPSIIPIYEAGRWPDGSPFYTMKQVEGRTLAELVGERSGLAERLALLPSVIAC